MELLESWLPGTWQRQSDTSVQQLVGYNHRPGLPGTEDRDWNRVAGAQVNVETRMN